MEEGSRAYSSQVKKLLSLGFSGKAGSAGRDREPSVLQEHVLMGSRYVSLDPVHSGLN